MKFLEMLATSGVGFLIVFLVLGLLMGVVMIMSLFNRNNKNKSEPKAAPAVAVVPAAVSVPAAPSGKPAPGSCGGIVLNGVEEKTAAMIMAIVANSLNKPLNELRFISIREVKE